MAIAITKHRVQLDLFDPTPEPSPSTPEPTPHAWVESYWVKRPSGKHEYFRNSQRGLVAMINLALAALDRAIEQANEARKLLANGQPGVLGFLGRAIRELHYCQKILLRSAKLLIRD